MIAGVAGPHGVEIAELPQPQAGAGQALIKVQAAGVNWGDLQTSIAAEGTDARGKAIGAEWAGEVVAVGAGVDNVAVGDHVAASGRGGYAEFAVADATRLTKLPPGCPPVQAAILPIVLMTARDALVTNGQLRADDAVLIHGGSTAVGIAALQIARRMGAGLVIATSRSPSHRVALSQWGADFALDSGAEGWADEVIAATGGQGANLILDMVSGPNVQETLRSAAVRGRIVNVGRLAGGRAAIDLELLALRPLQLIGVTFRTRSAAEIATLVRDMERDVWPWAMAGEIRVPIHREFALKDAPAAHALMRGEPYLGKLVIRP